MSAGPLGGGPHVLHDLGLLAPKFKLAVVTGITDANAAGYDAIVYETERTRALAQLYYSRGRTVKPPEHPVTNAPDETYTWHGFGVAVDVISKSKGWDQPAEWFAAVAEHFARYGCKWGGSWVMRDLPHFQFGACKPSPSNEARRLLATGGLAAVWKALGAD